MSQLIEMRVNITPGQLCEMAAPLPHEFAKHMQDKWGNYFNEISEGDRRNLIKAVVECQKRNIAMGNLRGR